MKQFNVTGMSCAACSARVEKAVSSLPSVESCAVNLLTNSMNVDGTASDDEIIEAVEKAGYGASLKEEYGVDNVSDEKDELKDIETPKLKKRLVLSCVFLIPLMYVSMGHMMWKWPVPLFLDGNHLAIALFEMIFTIVIMVINRKFFISGFKGLINKAPNMDTLVALGSAASFLYSFVVLLKIIYMISVPSIYDKAHSLMHDLYFESAATILTLITVGKMLEAMSKGRTTDALKGLMKLRPNTATIMKNGQEIIVPIGEVKAGDIFIVKPGESIPVDGEIIEGTGAIDESMLTGESIPIDKIAGDKVSCATINKQGYLKCKAEKVGKDTALAKIIQMVSDASATKAPIAKIADRVSGIFVPVVICIAIATFVIWMIAGKEVGYSIARAVSVLVISCPCALGLATPVAIMVGNGVGAKAGIMFKTAADLESLGKTQIICLDKTGTITKGEPEFTEIITCEGISEEELFETAYALETKSEHPLAKAVVVEAQKRNISLIETDDFSIIAGKGLVGTAKGKKLYGGNRRFIEKYANIPVDINNKARELSLMGKTPLYFAKEDKILGLIAVSDVVKDDSHSAISQLKKLGIKTVMLTGDNKATAEYIGNQADVDYVIAGVLPGGKEEVVKYLQTFGKVAMVGDGINDAPALMRSDTGIAIGAGTDIAVDAADVVVMKSNLSDVAAAIRLSRGTLVNIKQNLFWAFIYNIIGIPLAAGLYIPLFGLTLNPMFGAAAMSLSSFCVVTNALRLNLLKLKDSKNDKPIKNKVTEEFDFSMFTIEKEEKKMKINVTGMMCGHCEAHVKKALEEITGVVSATADHNNNTVEILVEGEVNEAEIKAAVENAGYEYGGVVA